jgi:5-amino-6-(5-phosphoribosylamino)uracil reductase
LTTNKHARFEAYCAGKIKAARDAALSPFITTLDRAGEDVVRIGNEWSFAITDGPFYVSPAATPELPSTSLVFVQSRDGNTGAANPSTLGGGETDKHVIYEGLSRVAADAVMAGAATVRGGNVVLSVWHPEFVRMRTELGLPRHPLQIVATLRGLPVEDAMLFNVPEIPVIVITVARCAAQMQAALESRPWVTTVIMRSPNDLQSAFRELRQEGIQRISCIGGRTLAGALIDAGLVGDLYLTTAAKPGGEPNTPLYPRPLDTHVLVRKHGTGSDAGVMFEHLTIR